MGKQTRNCDRCGKLKIKAVFYLLKPHPAVINLLPNPENQIVCTDCAMREEFGTKYKQSKKYKEYTDAKQK